jgi:hypothetical protein
MDTASAVCYIAWTKSDNRICREICLAVRGDFGATRLPVD